MNIENVEPREIQQPEQTDSFDIDKRINPEQNSLGRENSEEKYDVDKRIGNIDQPIEQEKTEAQEEDVFCEKTELYSTLEERVAYTPTEKGERGEWTGERGNSTFVPKYSYMKEELAKHGLDGVQYKNGIPDFSKVAETTVHIDKMTNERLGPGKNFHQADIAAAKKWSEEKRDGRTDWTPREVAEWRRENNFSWHERNDMQTMDLVPFNIHSYFIHSGGVSECRKRDNQEVTFDA